MCDIQREVERRAPSEGALHQYDRLVEAFRHTHDREVVCQSRLGEVEHAPVTPAEWCRAFAVRLLAEFLAGK